MVSTAVTADEFLKSLPEDRRNALSKLRSIFRSALPKGYSETFSSGMINFVVPHALYPQGYHCNPKSALSFLSVASQKNFVAVYHMGLYADQDLLKWFTTEYSKHSTTKPDMGKSCIRFRKPGQIPFDLIRQLAGKMSVKDWISLYEKNLKR
jgi:hypothetical protein